MDPSKAFDIMGHDAALTHLFHQGVKRQLGQYYDNLYTNIKSMIKWKGCFSLPFEESLGIFQGGVSSTNIFKARANTGLHNLWDHRSSL